MALDHLAVFDDEGDIGKRLVLQQLVEHGQQVRAMIVPSEAKPLRGGHGGPGCVSYLRETCVAKTDVSCSRRGSRLQFGTTR